MSETELSRQLGALRAWQQSQSRLLTQLQPWLQQQHLYTVEIREAIEQALRALNDEHLTVAVAGEFSRGKTELLNALFFADLGFRLLPADAGRTTMCPTEIFHDPAQPPHLALLPIETRDDPRTLNELRDDSAAWQVVPLPLDDPDALGDTLRKLTEHKAVHRDAAARLGLLGDAAPGSDAALNIPRWRLAQLNIPHPVLSRGLRVLDTPGLNAIGSEPELTYEMLPAAHAVLFVLGADTGVTQSDLQIWQRYILRPGHDRRPGLTVVLNKTDTLWDELRTPHQVAESILRQCRSVADTLGVDNKQIFAVSAQKALLARVQNNPGLETRSGIAGLEKHLGDALLGERVQLVRNEHNRRVAQMLGALETTVRGRLERNEEQRRSLIDLAGRSDSAIQAMLESTQADFARYQSNVAAYRKQLGTFQQHAQQLLGALNATTLDETLEHIHSSMRGAWTTLGLKNAMGLLFDEINQRIETAGRQTQLMRRLLRTTHRYFEKEHQFRLPPPPMFSIVRYQVELSLLEQEAEIFRNSPRTTLMEQHFVTHRYFSTIVSRVRKIIAAAHAEAQQWAKGVMSPLSDEVLGRRDQLAQRIQDLRHSAESRRTVQRRIVGLRQQATRQQAQLAALARVRAMLSGGARLPPARASGQN